MIRNVIFDIGNVLVDFDWAKFVRRMAVDEREVVISENAMWHSGLWNERDRGVQRDEDIFKKDIAVAISAIETHMGKWNTSKNSQVVLPKPKTAIQYMVHLADYIASRKCTTWDVEFDRRSEVNP